MLLLFSDVVQMLTLHLKKWFNLTLKLAEENRAYLLLILENYAVIGDIGEINKILKVLIFSPTTAIFVFVTVAGPSLYLNSTISSKNNIMPKLIFFSCLSVHQEENLFFFLRESVRYVYVKQCCTVSFKK